MKMIHIGDAHIRSQTWANVPQVHGDAYAACKRIRASADVSGARTLILSGDVFHTSKPTSEDIRVFNYLISEFDLVLYIEGNHEKSDPPWLESFADPKILKLSTKPVSVGGIRIFGIDYSRSSDDLKGKIAEVMSSNPEEKDLLVMHCGFKHMLNFEGASQLEASDVESFPGAVLVSHVHKRATYRNIHSPGPLFPQTWDEVGPCYVDLIDTETGKIEAIDVTVRNYHTIKACDAGEFSAEPSVLPSVVRVVLNDPKMAVPALDGFIVVPLVSSMKDTSDSEVNPVVIGKTIEQAIMEEYDDEEDGRLMLDLYTSESPKDVLDKLLTDSNIERRKL